MIDWLTLTAPLPHQVPIHNGGVMSIGPDGEIEWRSRKRLPLEGSHSATLHVRSCSHTAEPTSHVEVTGNPVKWFQGHNLWGTDDLPSLVVATMEAVATAVGVQVDSETLAAWERGEVQLTRVDVTESFHLGNRSEVLAFIQAAEQSAHLPYRGRGQLVKGSTLYFGKTSRRWSLKLYSKGQEIEAKGHGNDSVAELPAAKAWADRTLRAELTLRSLELKHRGLASVADWLPVDGVPFAVGDLLRTHLGALTMTTATSLPADVFDSLPPAMKTAVTAWEGGADLRALLSRRTFYRYRSNLLPHGIDIAICRPGPEVSNVVPLHRVLKPEPVGVPDWAQGTLLYFEPRRIA